MARKRSILKWVMTSIVIVVLAFVLLLFGLRFYFVQNFVMTQTSKWLSKISNSYVEVESVKFTILDDLLLRNVLVKDTQGDTLFYAQTLKAGFNSTIFGLLKKKLVITDVVLENAQLNIHRGKSDKLDNLQQFLKSFQGSSTEKDTAARVVNPFNLDVQNLKVKSVTYSRLDSINGSYNYVFVKEGDIDIEDLNLAKQLIVIDRINLKEPIFRIRNFVFDSTELQTSLAPIDTAIRSDATHSFAFQINDFELSEGQFKLDNERVIPTDSIPANAIDYKHLEVFDLNLNLQNFYFINQTYSAKLECLSLTEKSGFQLNQLTASELSISPTQTALYGMRLETPETSLGDTLVFQYEQYQDFTFFNDKVDMKIHFSEDAIVKLGDIMAFAPALNNNLFFKNNRSKQIQLSGRIEGTVNDLKGNNIVLQIDGDTRLVGSFDSEDLTDPSEIKIRSEFQTFSTNIKSLKQTIPNFSLPNNFDKLGAINYIGDIDLLLGDLVINGELVSRLGNAKLDIQFSGIGRGFEKANYSGTIGLNSFDLDSWLDDDNFGKISIEAKVIEGKGLTGKTADVTLSANVESFEYKKYNYQNATFEGRLNEQLFQGVLNVLDEHVNLSFKGRLDYTKDIPNFDFNLDVRQLDLHSLNLYKEYLSLTGVLDIDIDLPNNQFVQSEGTAFLNDLIIRNKNYSHQIESVVLLSTLNKDGIRRISVQSDVLLGTLTGQYELAQLPNMLTKYVATYFPNYARKFNIAATDTKETNAENRAELSLNILNTGDLTKIFVPKLDTLDNIKLNATFDELSNDFHFGVTVPNLKYDSIHLQNFHTNADFQASEGEIDIGIDSITLKNGTKIEPIVFLGYVYEEELDFGINYAKKSDLEYKANIEGRLQPYDSAYFQMILDTTNLNILGTNWDLSPSNSIVFGDSSIVFNSFELDDQNGRIIRIRDYEEKGLILNLEQFDINYLNSLLNYPILDFDGKYDLTATAKNIFKVNDLSAFIVSDALLINKDNWGKLQMKAFMENLNSSISTYLNIAQDEQYVNAIGYYNPPNYQSKRSSANTSVRQPNYFDLSITSNDYPIKILEYFLAGASNFEGTFSTDLSLKGDIKKPDVSGYIAVDNVAATIDFLNTRYFVDHDTAFVSNRRIDARGTIITDELGNTAEIKRGGLTHSHLKNLGVDLEVSSNQFLALNTTKKENAVFYGRGIGAGEIIFQGPFSQTDIFIRATTIKGTNITIPVSNTANDTEVNFIRFLNEEQEQKDSVEQATPDVKGVNLVMNLTMTDEAAVELLFDEQAGDILRGQGNGDLQINLNRLGEMSMYGNYYIQSGEYLFTLFNLVNKPFIVEQGGKIQWRGDPFNATINIAAQYKDLNTAVANLIPEYLEFASSDSRNRASQPTSVDLTMYLEGELFEPSISFGLGFPRLQGDLKTYVDNKLRTLEQDQNELNKQVFGLIVLGQFIPSDFSLSGQNGSDITINTVSELLANQLSIIVTDFFDEVFDDSNVISSIDFDIAYNRYKNEVDFTQENFFIYGEEIGIRQKTSLFDDKVTLIIGGNRTSAATSSTNRTALGGDIVVEAYLNKERTLRLRAYSIFEPSIVEGNDTKVGTGLSYRKEFGSFKELFQSIFKRKNAKDSLK